MSEEKSEYRSEKKEYKDIKDQNIIEYVKNELSSFAEKPFSQEDSLVLSQASYMHFDSIVNELDTGDGVLFQALYRAEMFDYYLRDVRDTDSNYRLLCALCASPRFRDIKLKYAVEILNEETDEQFSAVTFFLPDDSIYIAYRGTDATVIGWKEDMFMSFEDVIESQKTALEYFEDVAAKTTGKIRTGGHSKGGSLALYAAACAGDKSIVRITDVYNHDGPGLSKKAIENSRYDILRPIIRNTIPQGSLIGIIMNDGDYQVVYSDRMGIMQHDPFSWQIVDGKFLEMRYISRVSDKMTNALDEMMTELPNEEKRLVVDTVFSVVEVTGVQNFHEWPRAAAKELNVVLDAFKEIDPDTKERVKKTVIEILKIVFRNMLPQNVYNSVPVAKEKIAKIKDKIVDILDRDEGDKQPEITGISETVAENE